MRTLFLFSISLCFSIAGFSQSTFVKIYDLDDFTTINDFISTSDGGFILCGSVHDSVSYYSDWLIIKTDHSGDIDWQKIIETPGDYGSADYIFQTADGYIVAGSEGFDGEAKYNSVIRKLNSSGDSIWTAVYSNYPASLPLRHFSMLSDGSFLCGWNTDSDQFRMTKGSASGETLWTNDYDGVYADNDNFIVSDDVIFLTGLSSSSGGGSGWEYSTTVWKLDTEGNVLNTKILENFAGKILLSTMDNNLIVTGRYLSSGTPDWDDWGGSRFISMNSDLDILWEHDDSTLAFYPVTEGVELPDSSFAFLFQGLNSLDDDGDLIFTKLTPAAEIISHTAFESANIFNPTKMIRLADGTFTLAGNYTPLAASNKGFLMVIDSEGNLAKSVIHGTVFFDENDNMSHDSAEPGIPSQMIITTPGPLYAATDAEGNYAVNVYDSITYQITAAHPFYFNQTSPPDPYYQTAEVNTFYSDIDSVDFAINAISEIQDLEINVYSSTPVPGFGVLYTVTVNNLGTIPMYDYSIVINHDVNLSLDSVEIPYDTYIDNILTWNFAEIDLFSSNTFSFYMTLAADTSLIGTNLITYGNAEPLLSDYTMGNNADTLQQTVMGSFDPNHIAVEPAGETDMGLIVPETTTLIYTIDFQNTGNYPASFITVADTMDMHLNFSSMRTIAASHDYTVEFIYPNIIQWHFENIHLPDSTSDYLASQGFITFEIDILPDMPVGTTIHNCSNIYFDFNPAVRTNTVNNTLALPTAITEIADAEDIYLYPNPANDIIYLNISDVSDISVNIYSVTGKLLKTIPLLENNLIDISNLEKGIFLYTISEKGNRIKSGVLIKV